MKISRPMNKDDGAGRGPKCSRRNVPDRPALRDVKRWLAMGPGGLVNVQAMVCIRTCLFDVGHQLRALLAELVDLPHGRHEPAVRMS
ncbi:hypothetical protein JK364_46505 [Streptomyces sp. 110]|uniref:Transposase n=1 Tax=Streptomyces endocoffeicus TaxID=2898945 RepID=A0ABS1Q4W6_9ACTN|nr:hypothetical protein [Streptomyces endocoffeicus]MBL1119719.1 hypothetical protein [Streptomyces endocoffeicus]